MVAYSVVASYASLPTIVRPVPSVAVRIVITLLLFTRLGFYPIRHSSDRVTESNSVETESHFRASTVRITKP